MDYFWILSERFGVPWVLIYNKVKPFPWYSWIRTKRYIRTARRLLSQLFTFLLYTCSLQVLVFAWEVVLCCYGQWFKSRFFHLLEKFHPIFAVFFFDLSYLSILLLKRYLQVLYFRFLNILLRLKAKIEILRICFIFLQISSEVMTSFDAPGLCHDK